MVYHRQATEKAIEEHLDRAIGTSKTPDMKEGAKTGAEHVGIGCCWGEVANFDNTGSPCFSKPFQRLCKECHNNKFDSNGGTGTRTPDTRIMIPLL